MGPDDKAKILVVDDLAENILSYQAILEELGQELIYARSGEEALKEVLRHDFAVILLDVNMPGMDGLETAALIRGRKRSAHTPIIFVTAFTDEVRVSEGYAHGAVDYISNPVVPNILRAKVRVFVDLYRLNVQIRQHAEERLAHTQERLKREAAEESNRRLTFLARSGAIITRSLDQAVTIESILRIVVPEHAEHAVLAEQDETGSWQAVYARAAGSVAELSRSESLSELPLPWREAIERAIVSGSVEQRSRPHAPEDDAEHELLALPLRDRERVFAVLLLTRKVVGPGYAPADVAMFESLAWRSAIALVNARLYAQIERADQPLSLDARPRAAQPPGADPQRGRCAAAVRRQPCRYRVGPRRD
jgi:CheY-like chemotaxis protein